MTERYKLLKKYIDQEVTIKATFQKYGIDHATNTKSTCLKNLKIGNITIDHIWVNSPELVSRRLKTNQRIDITALVEKRLRAPAYIFDDPVKDLKLTILTKGKNK